MAKGGSLFLPADRPSNTPWNHFSSRKIIMVKGKVTERFVSQKWTVFQLTGKAENFFGFWKSTASIACTWISMQKHMKQCHFLGSHSLDDFPSNSQIFQLFPACQMQRQFLFTTEQRESSRCFFLQPQLSRCWWRMRRLLMLRHVLAAVPVLTSWFEQIGNKCAGWEFPELYLTVNGMSVQ